MYAMVLDMNATDVAVQYAIAELNHAGEPISAAIIAERIHCSVVTAKRSLKRLRRAEVIERSGSSRNGYSYAIKR